ncbi:MAG: VOC family protein [Planctomycetes bacterium]|nr:VOC family protein [Planctomycetota bacterium]
MRVLRLGHVNLSVPDLAAARAFYGDLLGLEPAPRPADAGVRPGCWFRLGEQELHVSEEPGADGSSSRRHVALEVDDLAAARARLLAAGLTLEEGRPLPGLARFFARDPGGNRLELYQVSTSAAPPPPPAPAP